MWANESEARFEVPTMEAVTDLQQEAVCAARLRLDVDLLVLSLVNVGCGVESYQEGKRRRPLE